MTASPVLHTLALRILYSTFEVRSLRELQDIPALPLRSSLFPTTDNPKTVTKASVAK